ncbi:MAG: hypothetical protein N3A01_08910 [Bacteroidales bacterium]|nr:hypothetical protein [Bacteroidales bacterium]
MSNTINDYFGTIIFNTSYKFSNMKKFKYIIIFLFFLVYSLNLFSQKIVSINDGIKANEIEILEEQIKVKGNFGILVNSTNVSCYGLCDGKITIFITGGSPVYPMQVRLTYPPDLGGGIVFFNNLQQTDFPFTITGLCGSQSQYLIRVRDADGHNSYSQASIMAPAQMFIDDYTITDESCNGSCNGSIEIEFVYNANYPIQYVWSSGETGSSSGNPFGIHSKCGGTYYVTITDNSGCTEDFEYTITSPTLLNIDSVKYTSVICSQGTGQITIYASGGTPPYYYDIGTGFQISNTYNNLNSGTYTITVADNMWCITTYGPITIQLNPAFTLSETHTNVQCYNYNNGSINLTVNGGTPPYSYLWSNGATTEDLNNLSPGIYTVTVTDASTCTATLSITITSPPPLTVTETHTNVTCYNGSNGSITLSVSGGTPGYSYTWTGPSCPCAGPNLTNIKAGTYNVTVTDANGCTKTLSINITQPPAIIVNATKQDATCYNTCNGWINLTITGGTPGYTFNWTGPFGYTSTNEDIYNLCAGWYYVTITDAAGCTAQRSFNIASPPAINVNFTNVVNPTCNGYCNGSFNTIISGGTPPYTYAWSGPSCPCSGLNLSNLCAGTYTITVTDFRGCTKIAQRTLVDPPGMSLSETHVNVNCYGQNTGSINLTVSGSYSLPLSYMWTGPNGYSNTTEDISNLYAGTYTVTVTEGGGCTKTLSVNITENNKLLVNAIVTNVSCAGANNGSINITVSGGNQPYSYQWIGPNGFNSTNEDISNLAVGTYNLTVNDVLGCTKDTSFNVSETTPITIIDSIINVKCYNTYTGSIYITVNGGNPPYSYQWQGPNGFSSTNEDIINLQAGNYFLTISDAANCSKTASFNVTQPSNFVFSEIHQNVLCYGNTDGWINISVTGATPPYSFYWQGPNGFSSTNEDIFNLTQGDYYLTITDQNSCTYTTSITINSNIQLIITETHNNLTCYNNNSGNINISVNGGTPPYFYNWNNGATTEDLVNLPAGTYKVTVTDSNGCKDSLTIVLTQPSDLYYTSLVNPPLCFGNCNGNAVITANGGTPPYTIIINGCLGYFASGNSPLNLTNLCDCGINGYNIQIIDNNGCIKDTMLTITAPLLLNVTITGVTYNNCSINCDATASASYSGGTAPISLTWSNGQTGNTATNLCAGWVYVTAQDANGCKDVDSIQITSPNPVNLNITNIQMSCYSPITGQALGNGIYVPDGPNCPQQCYNATIDVNFFPPGATVQSISDIQSICIKMEHSFAGDLSFKIKCPNNQSVFLDSFDHSGGAYLGQANDYDCLSCNTNPTNCPQGIGWNYCWSQIFPQQGLLNVLDGGASPIPPVNFNNNTNYFTPENSLSGLIGCPLNGTWTLEVCDNWLIDDGWLFSWQINFNPVLYNVENCNGSATVVPNGGTPPYSYQWSNGDNTPTTDSLCAGTYFVTVSDANGCSNTSSVTIQAINVQITSISKTNAACSGICNGSATVNYTGGLNPTTITWSNGQTTATINNLCAGWYYVTVESYGCKDIDSVQITNGYTLNVQHNITNQIKCFGNCDGSAIVFATNGSPPYSYNPSAILTNKCAGAYTVTVTDANGCSNTTTVNFVQPPALNIDSIKKNNIQPCYGNNNGSITIYVSGGVPPYLYNIGSGNQSSNTFTNLAPGVYTVTITDANNCTKVTNPITIVQPPQLVIDSITKTNVFPCYGNSNGTITVYVSGGVEPYTYLWSNNFTTQTLYNLSAGIYTVTVTDNNGCYSSASIEIIQPEEITLTINSLNASCESCCDGSIDLIVSGGTGEYIIQTNPNIGNQFPNNTVCPGVYEICVTDQHNCSKCITDTIDYQSIANTNISNDIEWLIYYNHIQKELNLKTKNNKILQNDYKVTIYNILGKTIKTFNITKGKYSEKVNTTNFNTGYYIIRINNNHKSEAHYIFIF